MPCQRQPLPTRHHPIKRTKKPPPFATPKVLNSDDITQISALKTRLLSKGKAVFVTGAGMSVNAGIPDFRTMRTSGQSSFDISVYNTSVATDRFHTMIRDMWTRSVQAEPTAFHIFMDRLAQHGRLLRHYTQNIDCIEQQLPALDGTTVQLHGRIDQALCHYCGWRGPLVPSLFVGTELPSCIQCSHASLERERIGKRRLGIGRLRPNIVLYGEENPDGYAIGEIAADDVRRGPDVLYVAGTALKVPGARKLARELCRATKARGGLTVWINEDLPPSRLGFGFDFVFQGDCDTIATLLSD